MHICFNPYFTGTTASTIFYTEQKFTGILFQSLFYRNNRFNIESRHFFVWSIFVSILILQEQPLQHVTQSVYDCIVSSFNPYFTGTTASTKNDRLIPIFFFPSFNPYFTGTTASTRITIFYKFTQSHVSILILQEQPLQHYTTALFLT